MENMQNKCMCPHHRVTPVLVILIGLTFLFGAWGVFSWDAVNVIWPVLVIIGGAMKFGERSGMCKCC